MHQSFPWCTRWLSSNPSKVQQIRDKLEDLEKPGGQLVIIIQTTINEPFSSQTKTSCCVITIFDKCTISVVSWSCVYVIKHKNTVVYFSLTSLPLGYISESTNSLHHKSTISSFNTGWCVQSRHSGQRGQERRRPR